MDTAAVLAPLLGAHLAVEATGDLTGLLTVVGTLAFVAACFTVVELLDRRGDTRSRHTDRGAPVSGLPGSGLPIDDVWPLRSNHPPHAATRRPTHVRRIVGSTAGAVLAFVVAVALIPVRSELGTASVALALVLVIVASVAVGGRIAAAVASGAAALAFNFTHTRPLYSFHIAHGSDVVASLLMIVIGIAVGELAARRPAPDPGAGSGAPDEEMQ